MEQQHTTHDNPVQKYVIYGAVPTTDAADLETYRNIPIGVSPKNQLLIKAEIEAPSGTLLNSTHFSDAEDDTASRGSIIYGNSSAKWDELAAGTANQVLQSDGTDVSWQTLTESDISDLQTYALDSVVLKKDGSVALTANWDAGSFKITAETFASDVGIGTAPFTVTSNTLVANLNADLLDGNEASVFALGATNLTAGTGLSGGGTLASDRTFNLDINSLTTAAPVVGDHVTFADVSDSDTPKKATITTLNSLLIHDNMAGFVANEHIDWTDASDNFKTSGSATIETAALAQTAATNADELIIKNSTDAGMSIFSGASSYGTIAFGDSTSNTRGYVQYYHDDDSIELYGSDILKLSLGSGTVATFNSNGLGIGVTPETWSGDWESIDIGSHGTIAHEGVTNDEFVLGANCYYDTNNSRWEYKETDLATRYSQVGGEHIWYYAASGTADTAITWSEAMRIDTSGNFGIGNTSPSVPLHVALGNGTDPTYTAGHVAVFQNNDDALDDAYVSIIGGTTGSSVLQFGDSGDGDAGWIFYNNPSHYMAFRTNNSEAMRINSSGNLLVGSTVQTTSAGAALEHVFKKSSGAHRIGIDSGNMSNNDDVWTGAMGRPGGSGERRGVLGVFKHSGITNAAAFCQLDADDGATNFLWSDNSDQLRISTNSAHIGTTSGTVVGTQTSDKRLKNIKNTFGYGLADVLNLKPIEFTFNDDPEGINKLGFGAQDVRKVLPEVVYDSGICLDGYDRPDEGKMRMIQRSNKTKLMMDSVQFIPVLVKAIQELSDKVSALEAN